MTKNELQNKMIKAAKEAMGRVSWVGWEVGTSGDSLPVDDALEVLGNLSVGLDDSRVDYDNE